MPPPQEQSIQPFPILTVATGGGDLLLQEWEQGVPTTREDSGCVWLEGEVGWNGPILDFRNPKVLCPVFDQRNGMVVFASWLVK